jgi:hypothetical protein
MPDELVNIGELIAGLSIVLERMLLETPFLPSTKHRRWFRPVSRQHLSSILLSLTHTDSDIVT